MCVPKCMYGKQRSIIDVGCLSLLLPPLFFLLKTRQGLSLKLEITVSARLAGYQDPCFPHEDWDCRLALPCLVNTWVLETRTQLRTLSTASSPALSCAFPVVKTLNQPIFDFIK